MSDILPRADWSEDTWKQLFARYGLPDSWTGPDLVSAYAHPTTKRLRDLFVAHPDSLEGVVRWHADLVALAAKMTLKKFKAAFGEGTPDGADNIETFPHLYEHRTGLSWDEAFDSSFRFPFVYLVDAKLAVLIDAIDWLFPGMSSQQIAIWLARGTRIRDIPRNLTFKDVLEGVRGEGVLCDIQGDLGYLAGRSMAGLGEDSEERKAWLTLACGAAADAVRLALPKITWNQTAVLDGWPELQSILNGLVNAKKKTNYGLVEKLKEVGRQSSGHSYEWWARQELRQTMKEIVRNDQVSPIMCRITFFSRIPSYVVSIALRQHLHGHILMRIYCWAKELPYRPPVGLHLVYCTEFRKIRTYLGLRRTVLWTVYTAFQKLSSLDRVFIGPTSLKSLDYTEGEIVSLFGRSEDPPLEDAKVPSHFHFWIMFDRAAQLLSKRVRHPDLGFISCSDALRLIMSEETGLTRHFGIWLMEESEETFGLRPLPGHDYILGHLRGANGA